MPTPYTTIAAVKLEFGEQLVDSLLDLNEDGSADAGALAARIADVDAEIDSRLGRRWPVPFADIGASPATPQIVQKISKYGLVVSLLRPRHPGETPREEYVAYKDEFEKLITELLSGGVIPGVAPLPPESSSRGFKAASVTPTFAGYDEYGEDRMKGY